jgi:hypothetical protein
MNVAVAYHARSMVRQSSGGMALALSPNLRRDRVSFTGTLRDPLRFREAISALHNVVISDLRSKPKDKSDYQAYIAEKQKREAALRRGAGQAAKEELLARQPALIPEGLEERFRHCRKIYWDARLNYSNYLSRHDPEMWRLLMPCDPVITVAPDVLFFECFSADESSYGCLTVERGAFSTEQDVALGTTNVDYSWALYEQFQKLRSYRQTQFTIDPAGFEVQTGHDTDYREEKIDLPPSWLRGFMQLQSAMSLPMRRVPVSREGLYNILAFLKRHRAARSPRAIRFELEPGKPVTLVLEPWEKRIVLHATPYSGPRAEAIRTWGRDRLRVLARLLPLAEGADVFLLGTGLPSFWSVRMGDMRLILGLSGWTANDWTGGSALDQLAPPAEPTDQLLTGIAAAFRKDPSLTFDQVRRLAGGTAPLVAAGLNKLALMGQIIHDLPAGIYRWRQIMPVAVSLEHMGPEGPETEAARDLYIQGHIRLTRDEYSASGLRLVAGQVPERPAEVVLDGDGRILRGKCTCSHHHQFGLRRGPCRHLQALRLLVQGERRQASLESWYQWLWN